MPIFRHLRFLLTLFAMAVAGMAYPQVQIGNNIDGEAAQDESGWSVSMPDANTVAIGAFRNDGNGTDAGHVRIYSLNGNAWVQKGEDIDGEAAEDWSGYSVNMPDSNTVAIGAPQNDGNGEHAGHVRVYAWNGSAWVQKGEDIDGEAAFDKSGWSVSMPDANTVAISAYLNDGVNGNNSGHVRVYFWNGSGWVQKGADIDGEAANDFSGFSVSMPDANTVATGARFNDGVNGDNSGHVRIFSWNGNAWVQKGLDLDGESAHDEFGWSISMPNANTIAVGAVENGGNGYHAGHVRVYAWNGDAWAEKGQDIEGEAATDYSGWSVSMPDANTVAIGAPYSDGNGTGTGQVRVFSWNGDDWIQLCDDIYGEAEADWAGKSVSMPDSNTVAIGAPSNAANGNVVSHVSIFSLQCDHNCDDGDPCTQDTYDPELGCQHFPIPDTDGDGFCDAVDSCPYVFGLIGDPCDDGIACTENDTLNEDCACQGVLVDALCDDGDPCTTDYCDFETEGCVNAPLPDSDGDGICDAMDSCPDLFGQIGDACDDTIACTENDTIDENCDCRGIPNDELCDDGDPDTSDSCDPETGCDNSINVSVPGAPQAKDEFGVSIFPNPVTGSEMRMDIKGLIPGNHEVIIAVYDIYGKLIQTEGFGHAGSDMSRLVRFDGNLAMGMYMVQIVVDGERFATERLVVK